MIHLELTAPEGAALLLLLILGHCTYACVEDGSAEACEQLDRIPTERLQTMMHKVEAAVAAEEGNA